MAEQRGIDDIAAVGIDAQIQYVALNLDQVAALGRVGAGGHVVLDRLGIAVAVRRCGQGAAFIVVVATR